MGIQVVPNSVTLNDLERLLRPGLRPDPRREVAVLPAQTPSLNIGAVAFTVGVLNHRLLRR